jgi:NADH-quinone oxidoreductase subunit J
MIEALAFYLFAFVAVASGVLVISAKNPVHSVLFLILAFFNAAGLFVLLGAEFLAMTLVVVYVGAVAVLFMFVVMMLDINFVEMRQGFLQYLPMGAVIGLVLLVELMVVVGGWAFSPEAAALSAAPTPEITQMTNTNAIGALLYTKYIYLFQAAGMVLLVAMIGAIVLTHRRREGVRKQNINEQVTRSSKDVELRDVEVGKGI